LLVPNKYLLRTVMLFTVTGMISHYYLDRLEFGNILTIACLDSLGIGALLAWYVHSYPDRLLKLKKALGLAAIISVPVFVGGFLLSFPIIPQRTLVSIFAALIICSLVYKNSLHKKPSAFLTNRFLLFVGKISFGLYLFHQLIPLFLSPSIDRFLQNNLSPSMQSYRFLLVSLITYGLVFFTAWLSWRLIESPALKLKRYFVPKAVHPEVAPVAIAIAPAHKIEAVEKE
jgi:peptidoglycan/LPS O-acetylase OafA/YrhL